MALSADEGETAWTDRDPSLRHHLTFLGGVLMGSRRGGRTDLTRLYTNTATPHTSFHDLRAKVTTQQTALEPQGGRIVHIINAQS